MSSPEAPDPTDTVRVLKSDFDLLQAAANAAQEDFLQWCDLLGIEWDGTVAPRTVMYEAVFPAVVSLLTTAQHVEDAKQDIASKAARFGNKTGTFAGGIQGIKVGERVDPKVFEMSRRERREQERRDRRGR